MLPLLLLFKKSLFFSRISWLNTSSRANSGFPCTLLIINFKLSVLQPKMTHSTSIQQHTRITRCLQIDWIIVFLEVLGNFWKSSTSQVSRIYETHPSSFYPTQHLTALHHRFSVVLSGSSIFSSISCGFLTKFQSQSLSDFYWNFWFWHFEDIRHHPYIETQTWSMQRHFIHSLPRLPLSERFWS